MGLERGCCTHLASLSFSLPLMIVEPVAMPLAVQLDMLALRHVAPGLLYRCPCCKPLSRCKVGVGTPVSLLEAAEFQYIIEQMRCCC